MKFSEITSVRGFKAYARGAKPTLPMFESPTLNLVQELSSVREFTVTEDHLKLLRRVYVAWDFGEGYGAPGINPKKPYGNSSVERDIAEILDVADEDWIYEDGHEAYVTPEAKERFTRLHVETMVALQIVLATGEFRPGRYRRATAWGIDWQRDESSR